MRYAPILSIVWLLSLPVAAGELSPLLLDPPRPLSLRLAQLSASRVRVAVKLVRPPDAALLRSLEQAGAIPMVFPGGLGRAAIGRVVSLEVPRHRLASLAAVPGVVRVDPAIPLFVLPPLDVTGAEVEAHAAWSPPLPETPALGAGVLIADHEGGWDPFHHDFFFPDGGVFDVRDSNHNGKLGPDDHIDLDGDGSLEDQLSLLEGVRDDAYLGEHNYAAPGYQPGIDWLYVDLNGNGRRDFGASFDEDTPGLGEPIFVGDDVDADGRLEPGERLVRLDTAKFRAIYVDAAGQPVHTYERGVDLSQYPVPGSDASHGCGATGIVAGGWPGLRTYTGLAPAAELVGVQSDDLAAGVAWARNFGADVSLYELSLPGQIADGSSPFEVAISEAAAAGVAQVAAAGNLADSDHCMELTDLQPGSAVAVGVSTDGQGMYQFVDAFLGVTWIGARSDVALALLVPDGTQQSGR